MTILGRMPSDLARDNVIALASARARRSARSAPARTLIVRANNIQADGETYRQVGLDATMPLEELHRVLDIVFGIGDEQSPWRFEDDRHRTCTPDTSVGTLLQAEGDVLFYFWGLWQFNLQCLEIYPRDNGPPRALCIGGSGGFHADFDQATINAELTGTETIRDVLTGVRREVVHLVDRTGVFDFIPLLQALDLRKQTPLDERTSRICRSLPAERGDEGSDAFWTCVLALSCLGGAELFTEVIEATMAALGWVADDGGPLSAAEITGACAGSLAVLDSLGAYGMSATSASRRGAGERLQLAPVDRLDIYRELLRA